jgi:hypothetical protein
LHRLPTRQQQNPVASSERVGTPLRRLWQQGAWTDVTLGEAVAWEVGDRREVSAPLAAQLGAVVGDDLLDAMEGGSEPQREEAQALRAQLGDLRFKGRDGRYHESRELLVAEGDARDEQRRAEFAPADRVLDGAYQGDALSFFLACRPPFEAPARAMAEWVRTAPDRERRLAGLRYLLDGERGQEVVRELRGKTDHSWLAGLAESDLAGAFGDQEWGELLLRLWLIAPPTTGHGPDGQAPDDPRASLARLADWWADNGGAWTAAYERRIYPDGRRPAVTADLLAHDVSSREEWLALLTHGALHTIGRTQPGADRSFVKLWRDRGWLRTFADPRSLADEATRVLDEFLDDRIDWIPYFHWMRQFPAVYLLAKWLSEYVPALLAIDRYEGLRSLNEILRLRTNPDMGGGGYDAPPIDQALGIGANFVVRELARFGVLKKAHAHPHCFVPSLRIRALLQNGFRSPPIARGDEGSRQIHAFLVEHLDRDGATFGLSFDLPLVALTEHPGLQLLILNGPVSLELPDGDSDDAA